MTHRRLSGAIVALVLVTLAWYSLPPAARRLSLAEDARTVRGAIHVHTVRSDGTGTPEDVAHAAHRASLDFVLLTDHGDATRAPSPPRYVDGVLVVDAVEISTTGGHYVALGLGQAPYRLAGDPRDVAEDVHRFGGFGFAAHPDSRRSELAWRDWQAPIDGLEWLNADSQWRDEPRTALARALLSYWLRGPEAVASLFDRPVGLFARWDSLTQSRPVIGIAGHDAHARMSIGGGFEPSAGERSLNLPSYESAFRTFAVRVQLNRPFSRQPDSALEDADTLLTAIHAGRVYTAIDALAGPARLRFTARSATRAVEMGESLADPGPIDLTVVLQPDVPGATLVLARNGREIATAGASRLQATHPADDGPAVYRVEVRLRDAPGSPPVPWIVGNPIYLTRGVEPVVTVAPVVRGERIVYDGGNADRWAIERHSRSEGAVDTTPGSGGRRRLHFSWRLAGGPRVSQYVALALPVDGAEVAGMTRLSMRVTASRQMRLSVQLRAPDSGDRRWRRSVYVGTSPTVVSVPLSEMVAVDAAAPGPLDAAHADTLLFVVDTVNTAPGTAGETWFDDVRWLRTDR